MLATLPNLRKLLERPTSIKPTKFKINSKQSNVLLKHYDTGKKPTKFPKTLRI